MAKIVTITNPLTGQPAQVDQLDHTAQQIDDGVKHAIEYGLGDRSRQLTSADDVNTIFRNGWYWWGTDIPQNAPITGLNNSKSYTFMRVTNYDNNNFMQEYWNLNDDAKYKTQRICRGGAWQPIEWVNPPMKPGDEYRTTERHNNGKPVYVKLIDVGQMPNTDQLLVSADIGNNMEATVISFDGYMDNGVSIDKFPVFWSPGNLKAYMFVMVNGNKWKVGVRSLIDLSAYTAKCLIKYTKIEG